MIGIESDTLDPAAHPGGPDYYIETKARPTMGEVWYVPETDRICLVYEVHEIISFGGPDTFKKRTLMVEWGFSLDDKMAHNDVSVKYILPRLGFKYIGTCEL